MKKSLQLLFGLFLSVQLFGQNFTGQWKGQFTDNSTSFVGWGGDRCDYVIEIECKGNIVTGYSYTYFNEGGKRFYTICRLSGKLEKGSKSIELTEVERTKTNVPNNIRNCFQIHKLTFFQQGQDQTLEGTWIPAPNQEGDCGYGTTSLTRRILQKNPALMSKPLVKNIKPEIKQPVKAIAPVVKKNTVPPPIVKNTPKAPVFSPVIKNNTQTVKTEKKIETPPLVVTETPKKPIPVFNFEKRNNNLLKTIEIENESFMVALYDNGEIDGDSISLIYNGRPVLQHKRLGTKALSLTLDIDKSQDINELVMYAENLGEIPPNTALMVVTDGDNRYEVRISSDLEKSGVIRFVHKPKPGQ